MSSKVEIIFDDPSQDDNRISDQIQRINELKAATAAANFAPYIISMCGVIPTDIGASDQYLPEIIKSDKIKSLRFGESAVVHGPTGCGKSRLIVDYIADKPPDEKVVVLTPRRSTKRQLRKEVANKLGIPPDKAEELLEKMNVYIMTYQRFVRVQNMFKDMELIVFLDECHCLSSDATFAMYPQLMLQWLENNLDNTKRVYLSATIATVLPLIWSKEYIDAAPYNPYIPSPSPNAILDATPEEIVMYDLGRFTRIKQLVLMKANWNYIHFKYYNPNEPEKLAAYVNDTSKAGKKTLIFINNIDKGSNFNQLLDPKAQQIYSDSLDERLNEEIDEITMNSKFEGSALITTKVANLGVSIHDSSVDTIIVDSYDPEDVVQIIGRVRVDRKNPRDITVLLPDYSSGDLGQMEHLLLEQLKDFRAAKINPYTDRYIKEPYSVPSPIKRALVTNELAIKTLDIKLKFIQKRKAEERDNPHAFLRYILRLYGKEPVYSDEMRIDYDNMVECRKRLEAALAEYANDQNMTLLRQKIVTACAETGAYTKKLEGTIKVDTINKVFEHLGIPERLGPKREVYDVIASE